MSKRALITGINGFVGPYMKKELKRHGYDVVGLGKGEGRVEGPYHAVDITDELAVSSTLNDIQPDVIVHLAGISSPPFAEKHPALTYAVNVGGTKNVLDAALSLSVPPTVLIVSSNQVYGNPKKIPVDEAYPLEGMGVYAQSRIEQEQLVASYTDRLPIVMTRSFNHTGPGQTDTFVVAKILKQVIEVHRGIRSHLEMGDPTVRRDITDVRDVVRAYRLLIQRPASGETYNVCHGSSIALNDIIALGSSCVGRVSVPIVVNPAFVRRGDPSDIYGSFEKIRNATGWEPMIPYEQMIRDIVAFWKHWV